MIASAQAIQNGFSRALGEWVCLRVCDSGSVRFPGEGDHEGRPYKNRLSVGATLVVALRSEHTFQEVT
jgi:hypothetical protein